MKHLIRVLILGSTFFVLAGMIVVQADELVKCSEPKCIKTVYLAPNDGMVFDAECDQQDYYVENMVCHKAKGVTCTKATYKNLEWTCNCTNWDEKTRSTTVDVWCAQASE